MVKNLSEYNKIHFIGIGGIGISAIARMFLAEGKQVSGSDSSDSEIIRELRNAGATIYIGHNAENITEDTELVIYTIAITKDNPEFKMAEDLHIDMLTYPQTLNNISKEKYTIAVSGTHGKTTTTAMIAKILIDLGMDPTVIVGSLLKEQKSNFISGKSKYFVVEACEYRRSFLNIEPKILVITNIDDDHLDYYKDIKDIQSAFHEMAMKVPEDGYIVYFSNDPLVCEVLHGVKAKKVDALDSYSHNMKLAVPGEHNKKDGAMALTVAGLLKIEKDKAEEKLSGFSGTWRRFEYKGQTKYGALVYDDYGHHPTEIRATLAGAREYFGNKKIIVVFQPHLFSRTKLLLSDFANAFTDADQVLLTPIYPARERFDASISAEMLAEKIGPKATAFDSFETVTKYLMDNLSKDDILMTVGAGDIYKVGEEILK